MGNRNIFLLLIFCLLICHFLKDLQFSYYPDSSKKVISVKIEMEGAGPEEIENLLCNPLEEEILMMPGISHFYSRSGWEETEITLFLDELSDLNNCYLDLRAIIERKSAFFPPSAGKAVIRKSSSLNSPVFIFVPRLMSDKKNMTPTESWTEERIRSELKGISGISQIHLSSSSGQDINIEFEEDMLSSIQQNALDLAGIIHQHNSISALSLDDSSELVLDQRLKSISDFETLALSPALELSETADINIESSAVKSLSRLNGRRQSISWIYESGDANTIDLCRKLRTAAEKIPGSLILYDRGELIEEALKELFQILCLSLTAVILITLLILKNFKAALPVCLNIPFSIGGTVAIFNMLSWEINILVLSSLALCSGMIIDCGIIVLEQGFEKSKRALWSSLVSTLIALTPFLFASPGLKFLCTPLIRALCICLTLSVLFIVLTMKQYNGRSLQGELSVRRQQINRIAGSYTKYKKYAVLVLILITIPSLLLMKNLNYSQDFKLINDSIRFSVEFPAGSSKEWIEIQLMDMEESLGEINAAEYYSSEYKDEKAGFHIKLSDISMKDELEESIKTQMMSLPGFLYFDDRPAGDSYHIRILAHMRPLLYSETEKLAQFFQRTMNEQNLTLHYKKQQPLLCVQTDNNICMATGISPLITARSLGKKLSPPVLGKWVPGDGIIYDIRIFNKEANELETSEIGKLKIEGKGSYALEDLAVLSNREDYGPIEHFNSQRSTSFSFSTEGLGGKQIHKTINRALNDYNLPEGVRVIHGEEYRIRRNNIRELIKLLTASILLLFILLIFIFESPFLPLCLMGQIILCHIFTLGFLRLLKVNLSVPVFFALILNTGLSINNGLIVFSRFRKKRPSLEEALNSLLQCRSTIVTAALTTLTGFIPFLGAGESSAELLKALSLTVGSAVIISILLLVGSLFIFKPDKSS
ncbi:MULTISPECIES: efflux RND transporter permease subunit [unclassified Oceanispirochaeta]|uniref:efflux RND transporter permease subunit n=1 Tax=unclassified Oceanispirochaeta TaxID=2635722 RepID=UPI000E08D907|nr:MULTISPECIES: efflux RND transporter permease subunit [unclassified Oceanispirochaeta]RDG30408.1 AcrB/AcrD/AcrF family protein [Oceanispirochaeta sp. M1]